MITHNFRGWRALRIVVGITMMAIILLVSGVNAALLDKANFVSETILDNTVEPAGQTFSKTWTLKNTGTTTCSYESTNHIRHL
jgi:hypothetical protein